MKILDRYVAKNFLIGYAIAFCVLMGLRIMIDLFVSMDEFTEHADLGVKAVIGNITRYYLVNSTLYFRDFSGMITVVAAVFSLGRMIRSNELVAVMASGISLKRVIAPIIILSILLTGLFAFDQEYLIPKYSQDLVRDKDDLPGQESYDVWFIGDEYGSLINSRRFDVSTATLEKPTIILRKKKDNGIWIVSGWIDAEKAVYNPQTKLWDFVDGSISERDSSRIDEKIDSYKSDIGPTDIPILCDSRNKDLLSWGQLSRLARGRTKVKDLAQLYSQMHFHITDPIINFAMLLVALPVLVCRDPKTMKSAVMKGFTLTTLCFLVTFACKMFATEVIFDAIRPQLWAWLPVVIFFPLAILQLDSMKT